jgi:hypothetical protein
VKTLIDAKSEEPEDWEGPRPFQSEPLFTVDPSCTNLIEEFGMYAFPDNAKIETDKPVKEYDHSMDALRYVTTQLVLPRMEVGLL